MVDLPVIVDWIKVEPSTGEQNVRIEARIDLVNGTPEIVEMSLVAQAGLDLEALQRDFRWGSPLAVVTGILPRLIAAGSDPFAADLPVTGFPARWSVGSKWPAPEAFSAHHPTAGRPVATRLRSLASK